MAWVDENELAPEIWDLEIALTKPLERSDRWNVYPETYVSSPHVWKGTAWPEETEAEGSWSKEASV